MIIDDIATSECVSLGHPDKVADYVSSYLLDRFIERDPFTRYAVEVQIKDNNVTLGGEVASRATFAPEEIAEHVRAAVREIGYTRSYAALWGSGNAPDADALDVVAHIGSQSQDIARGVDADGWGDQGIFFGMATPDAETGFMPRDHWLAKRLCDSLFTNAETFGIGIDIKTQVELAGGEVSSAIVAAPSKDGDTSAVEAEAKRMLGDVPVIVNGTGSFVKHASMGDCGTTGRKLAIDLYGGNCRIGGGSPWAKDGTKADVALNIYARKIAVGAMRALGVTIHCAIACCIGRREISVTLSDSSNRQISAWREDRKAESIIRELDLRSPRFASMCRRGLFSDM